MKSTKFDFAKLYGEPQVIEPGTHSVTLEIVTSACTESVLMVRYNFDGTQEIQSYRKGTTDNGVVYDLIAQFAKNLCRQTRLPINDALDYAKENPILVDVKVTESGLINIMPKSTNYTTVEVSEEDLDNVF